VPDANGLFEKKKNAALTSTVSFASLGIMQSQIRNPHSTIVDVA